MHYPLSYYNAIVCFDSIDIYKDNANDMHTRYDECLYATIFPTYFISERIAKFTSNFKKI